MLHVCISLNILYEKAKAFLGSLLPSIATVIKKLKQLKFSNIRGGVEHTRLEAKAKDTKKFRGQGQTLSRPRPRTKDTDASVFQEKKSSSKFFFQAIST